MKAMYEPRTRSFVADSRNGDSARAQDLISVLIISWQTHSLTSCLLEDLAGQTQTPREILILDNGSEQLAPDGWNRYSRTRVIRSDRNLGYSGGMKRLVEQACGEYVWLLNNDLRLPPDALERAVELLDAGYLAIFPLVLGMDGQVQAAGSSWTKGRFFHPVEAADRARKLSTSEPYPVVGDNFIAPLLRRQWLIDHEAFDDRFHTYAEDFDISYLLSMTGEQPMLCPTLTVRHVGGASRPSDADESESLFAQGIGNYLASIYMNYQLRNLIWALPYGAIRLWLWHGIIGSLRRGGGWSGVYLHWGGIVRATRLILGSRDRRAKRQESRTESDATVWSR